MHINNSIAILYMRAANTRITRRCGYGESTLPTLRRQSEQPTPQAMIAATVCVHAMFGSFDFYDAKEAKEASILVARFHLLGVSGVIQFPLPPLIWVSSLAFKSLRCS